MLTNKEFLKNFYNSKYGDIAEFIYNYPKPYQQLCTNEIATACNVSPSTITRLIQKAGFDGFAHLKYQLVFTEYFKDNNAVSTYLIRDMLGENEYKKHEQIADIIEHSKHIYIFMDKEYHKKINIDLQNLDQERIQVCDNINLLQGVINDPCPDKCIVYLGEMDINIYARLRKIACLNVVNIQISEEEVIVGNIESNHLINLHIRYQQDLKNTFVSAFACLAFYLNFLFAKFKQEGLQENKKELIL